ncbi:hypothetical protein KC19_4G102800 [Ceratodon purpureus]|uniref:Uncharacterized protein n=1 Tax=Ceratodon purpureus TaxID=3225 RepID=A0A8T0I9Q8_CERPU|nr:hypothetical protein KC19_4G102800 [Ceratodon purpureus]
MSAHFSLSALFRPALLSSFCCRIPTALGAGEVHEFIQRS